MELCKVVPPMPTDGVGNEKDQVRHTASSWTISSNLYVLCVVTPRRDKRKKYILLAVQHLSGWPILRAVNSQIAINAVQFFKQEIVSQFESPCMVLTDNGPAFT